MFIQISKEALAMGRNAATTIERLAIAPTEGDSGNLGGVGVVWKIEGFESEGRFSVVEHPIPPRSLAAPLHFHHREDEYSYVLEGTMGGLLGDEVVEAGPGTWVFKPRGEWHTFWNAGDTPCRIIEVISPSGFENFFRELAEFFEAAAGGPPDLDAFAELNERYGLEMQLDSIPELCERFGLTHPMLG
jgi:mannose-6-phosphate isomerase-like protein (cupin superfamily)